MACIASSMVIDSEMETQRHWDHREKDSERFFLCALRDSVFPKSHEPRPTHSDSSELNTLFVSLQCNQYLRPAHDLVVGGRIVRGLEFHSQFRGFFGGDFDSNGDGVLSGR